MLYFLHMTHNHETLQSMNVLNLKRSFDKVQNFTKSRITFYNSCMIDEQMAAPAIVGLKCRLTTIKTTFKIMNIVRECLLKGKYSKHECSESQK